MLPEQIDQCVQAVTLRYELYTMALRGAFAQTLSMPAPHSAMARSAFGATAKTALDQLFPEMAAAVIKSVDAVVLQAIADAGADGSVESLELAQTVESTKSDLHALIAFVAKSDARRAVNKLRHMGLDRRLSNEVRSGRDTLTFKTNDSVGRAIDSARFVVLDLRHTLVRLYVEVLLVLAREQGATHFTLYRGGSPEGRYQISGMDKDSYLSIREGLFHPSTSAYPVIERAEPA